MHHPMAVLVVDDDASTQGLLVAVVKHLGLEAHAAGDGKQALAMIASEKPAAVILDLIMPEVDGFEVLRQLRLTAPDMLRRVIVVTAAAGQRIKECEEIHEVWKFFRKPLDIDDLSAALLDCVGDGHQKAGRDDAYEAPSRP
jgi:two-component system response regulator MprA